MRVRPVRPVFTGAGGAVDFDSLRGVFFMSDLKQAAQQALEAMDYMLRSGEWYCAQERADALRAALAQPEQEPVAWMTPSKKSIVHIDYVGDSVPNWTDYYTIPLYLAPSPCPTCESLARAVMMDQTGAA